MLTLPPELSRRYTTCLARHGVAVAQQPHYTKWLRYYWDFCQKYGREPTARQSFPAFREKLHAKHQSEAQCQQAEAAVALYYELVGPRPRGKTSRRPREERRAVRRRKAPGRKTARPPLPAWRGRTRR